MLLLFSVFGKSFNVKSLLIFILIELFIFVLGGVKMIQNNYIVHILTLGFTPFIIALQVKHSIFD